MRLFRYAVFLVSIVLFPGAAGVCAAAEADATPPAVIFDPAGSALLQQSTYIDNLSVAMATLLKPRIFELARSQGGEAVGTALEALLDVGITEMGSLSFRGDQFLFSLLLPQRDLESLGKGDLSYESLRKAFGDKAAALLPMFLTRAGVSAEASPVAGVYKLFPQCFYTVVGKHVVLGSESRYVEIARKLMQDSGRLVDMEHKGQQFWSKTEVSLRHASSREKDYSTSTLAKEYFVYTTDEGLRYTSTNNLADFLPGLAKVEPLHADSLPLFGDAPTLLVLLANPQLLTVINAIQLPHHYEGQGLLIYGGTAKPLEGLNRMALVLGAAGAQFAGIPIPSLALSLEGTAGALTFAYLELTSSIPAEWVKVTREGLRAADTASLVKSDNSPIPVPLFVGLSDDSLLATLLDHKALDAPKDGKPLAQSLLADKKSSLAFDMDLAGIWKLARESFKPGTPLRSISGLEAKLGPAQMQAVDALLGEELPVTRWRVVYSTDLRTEEGVILVHPDPSAFVDKLCVLLESMLASR